jgi:CRP/FNR family transcriptional regulator, cyclic AMP receptor protein
MLRDLPGDVAELVVRACRKRQYAPNEAILHAGDHGDTVHMIVRGHVAIMITTPHGQQLAFSILGPDESFGELSLLLGRRTATARALDTTETLALPAVELDRLRRAHPTVNDALLRVLSGQVRRLSDRLTEHLYLTVDQRIRRRLLDLCRVYGASGDRVTVPLAQEQLAELAGAARPTVNRVLRQDESRGIVKLDRRQIAVLDRDALGRLAQVEHDT